MQERISNRFVCWNGYLMLFLFSLANQVGFLQLAAVSLQIRK